jgi:hypothetical protein
LYFAKLSSSSGPQFERTECVHDDLYIQRRSLAHVALFVYGLSGKAIYVQQFETRVICRDVNNYRVGLLVGF